MDDLEFVTLPDLVAEIQRRTEAGAICTVQTLDGQRERTFVHHWGGVAAIGCSQHLNDMARMQYNDNSDEDDYPNEESTV